MLGFRRIVWVGAMLGVGAAGLHAQTALVDPKDEKFDPQSMEAVASVQAEAPEEDDTVSDVFQKGYRFNGVLIRPARVRVRKHD